MTGSAQAQSFSFERGHRPIRLRLANAAGGRLGRVGKRLIPLSVDSMVRAAERKTGIRDPGDAAFREPLERLLESIETDANLNTVGRWAVRDETIQLLCKRLRLHDYLTRHPHVRDVPVERPVFIVGFPRTGSTFLHNLMALDPANRVPRLWELLNPVPPADSVDGREDPRLDQAREYIRTIEFLSPLALKIHPMGAEEPDECRLLLEPGFVGPQYLLYYKIPAYFDWFSRLSDERLEAACLQLRSQIQVLKDGDGGRRWVGKNPSHSFFGRGLVRAFPDACVVQLHRDPAQAVPSICSLVAAYRSIFSDRMDPATLGEEGLRMFHVAMSRMAEMRSMPPPASFCDIQYEQIVSDPLGVVRSIYEHAGMRFSDELEGRICEYVALHPQHKGGVHRYSPEQYGLTHDEIEQTTEPYARWLQEIT
jgi:hypothetical protein